MRFLSIILLSLMSLTFSSQAQNRWNIYAGGSISHLCEKPWISSDKTYGWGGGAFIGGGYEINFNSHWSLTPQCGVAFHNNGASLSAKELDFYANHANWQSVWSIDIPVITSFRFQVSDNARLRFGAGPYLQEAIAGCNYKSGSSEKESRSGNFSNRFNVGAIGEIAVETGSHFSYMFRTQYPFLKEGWVRKTISLSLGIRYSF